MIDNNKIKDMIENAFSQQRQMIETNYSFFKNIVENAYLQNRQMIETNALSMETYVRMFGNNDLVHNLENTKRDFLNYMDQSKEKLLNSLDQNRDDLLSNALKIKNNYENGANALKSVGGSEGESGKTKVD